MMFYGSFQVLSCIREPNPYWSLAGVAKPEIPLQKNVRNFRISPFSLIRYNFIHFKRQKNRKTQTNLNNS